MMGPIYKLWLVEPKNGWYQLSPEEQQRHLDEMHRALETVGGKSILMSKSAWCDEQWQYFGVEEFPDIQSVEKFVELLQKMKHYQYFRVKSMLGTKLHRA